MSTKPKRSRQQQQQSLLPDDIAFLQDKRKKRRKVSRVQRPQLAVDLALASEPDGVAHEADENKIAATVFGDNSNVDTKMSVFDFDALLRFSEDYDALTDDFKPDETDAAVDSIVEQDDEGADAKTVDVVVAPVTNPNYFVCERVYYLNKNETVCVSVGYNSLGEDFKLSVKLRSIARRAQVVFTYDEWRTFTSLYLPLMEGFFKGDESFDLKFGSRGDMRLKTTTAVLSKGVEKRINIFTRGENDRQQQRNPFYLDVDLWANLRIIITSVSKQIEALRECDFQIPLYWKQYDRRCRELDQRPLLEYFEPAGKSADDEGFAYDDLFHEFGLLCRKLYK